MKRVNEVIVVEGKFDKNAVAQVIDAAILETSGFSIFSDKDKLNLLRRLAEKRGLIVLTDSDSAGFFIRGRLKGAIDSKYVKHAYIPDVYGKEKRKSSRSREGKVGVEGMDPAAIIRAIERAGAHIEELSPETCFGERISKTDMYEAGLSGGANSAEKRKRLCKRLDLPERMSANALLDVLNALLTRKEFAKITLNDTNNER